jgi:hypothetical protein
MTGSPRRALIIGIAMVSPNPYRSIDRVANLAGLCHAAASRIRFVPCSTHRTITNCHRGRTSHGMRHNDCQWAWPSPHMPD